VVSQNVAHGDQEGSVASILHGTFGIPCIVLYGILSVLLGLTVKDRLSAKETDEDRLCFTALGAEVLLAHAKIPLRRFRMICAVPKLRGGVLSNSPKERLEEAGFRSHRPRQIFSVPQQKQDR